MSRNQRLDPISIDKPGPVNITKVNVNDNNEKTNVTNFQSSGPVQGNHMLV